jgi:hypothetical protein
MAYYMGDYRISRASRIPRGTGIARGDFWGKLGKGVRRLGRSIGKVATAVAPVAGMLIPGIGAATLVGRGIATAQRVKATGRAMQSQARTAELKGAVLTSRSAHPSNATAKMGRVTPQTAIPAMSPVPMMMASSSSPARPRAAARRSAYRRRRSTARRSTRRRRTTRRTRRRS